ncbi:MAG: nitronate monooxygenase [Clostridiaceae bacterium]|jgi:NAD(P)H-dependent flavin oxidoreductase YrpB (nitropropane dioxygenase family)|nr:nitronate monooxygenase [Eubacteriales bacterium]MDD4140281.1 nitronate monooxygenase [Eubacteriales bacterium]NLB45265.1 nitronate monooxygenase [Clostridiaceae bacterium]
MKCPSLKIAHLTAVRPIIQGGMAVRISTARLAAAVANEGGIGVIAGTGMSVGELQGEIRQAKKMSNGILGVNVLFAVSQFAELVKAALAEKINLILSGAGFSRDMFVWGRENNIPIVPIVSSAKLAFLAQKLGAAAVVVEGKEAGGHLGTDRPMRDILPEVRSAVSIPVIGAGGIIDGHDLAATLKMGADGVQMGTRFAASLESNASDDFKRQYLRAKQDDVIQIHSPVGLPGQALRSDFVDRVEQEGYTRDTSCVNCLKRCSHSFCIMDALVNACSGGDPSRALVFCGEAVHRIREILSVKDIFSSLMREAAFEV